MISPGLLSQSDKVLIAPCLKNGLYDRNLERAKKRLQQREGERPMAQLVFVHGVATRDSTEYRLATASRDALFRDLLLSGRNVSIRSPMWGQFVPLINPGVFETDRGGSNLFT